MLQSALKFAEINIPVFPVHGLINGQCTCGKSGCPSAGKHPVPFNGFKSATCDPTQVEQWWSHHPHANIGLPTGRVSGLVVIDIDPRHGGDESFFDLEKQYQAFPPTKEVLTGGGGQHTFISIALPLAWLARPVNQGCSAALTSRGTADMWSLLLPCMFQATVMNGRCPLMSGS